VTHAMQKPAAVIKLFDKLNASSVALIDTDTIWLRDPFPWLAQHPAADMFVTTDCLSHEAEVERQVVPRCGHVPGGLGGGMALNTGMHLQVLHAYKQTETGTTACIECLQVYEWQHLSHEIVLATDNLLHLAVSDGAFYSASC
jgi:Nucleotide-diphospho-sugar transferase